MRIALNDVTVRHLQRPIRMKVSAPSLQALAPDSSSTDSRVGDAGRLLLRAVGESLARESFLSRRAIRAAERVEDPVERGLLTRVAACLLERDHAAATPADDGVLLEWGGFLEGRGRLTEAVDVFGLARRLRPEDPCRTLHLARVERKRGRTAEAGRLYREISSSESSPARIRRMAAIGSALLEDDPEDTLSRVLREAVGASDAEAAAVAQEARAGVRRSKKDRSGAVRDLLIAAARYSDRADLGRIGHELADYLVAIGEPHAARAVLLETLRRGHPDQIVWARARLHAVSRALGDEIGRRRWADSAAPALTSLTPRSRRAADYSAVSSRIVRHLERLTRRG